MQTTSPRYDGEPARDWHCPRCSGLLATTRAGAMEVDACPECAGIWFDAGELARIAAAPLGAMTRLEADHRAAAGAVADHGYLGAPRCPMCRVYMAEFEYPWAPGIVLDACGKCGGIWVDDGELARMEAFVARHRPPTTPPPADRLTGHLTAAAGFFTGGGG